MITRHSRHRETLKRIYASISEEERLNELVLKSLYRSVLSGNRVHADIIAKATIILFPMSGVMISDTMFRALWKLRKYQEAIFRIL